MVPLVAAVLEIISSTGHFIYFVCVTFRLRFKKSVVEVLSRLCRQDTSINQTLTVLAFMYYAGQHAGGRISNFSTIKFANV